MLAPLLPPPAPTLEVFQLARSIAEFQQDSHYSRDSQINPYTQRVVNHILSSNSPVQPTPRTPPKRKTRTAQASSSRFYSDSWKVFTVLFEQAVSHFKMLVTGYNLPTADMDPTVEQSIASIVTSAMAAAVDVIQTKHSEEMLALREMIEKSLLLRDSSSSTPSPNLDAAPKAYPATESLFKVSSER